MRLIPDYLLVTKTKVLLATYDQPPAPAAQCLEQRKGMRISGLHGWAMPMIDRPNDVRLQQIVCVGAHQIQCRTIGQTEHRQARRIERHLVILVHDLQNTTRVLPSNQQTSNNGTGGLDLDGIYLPEMSLKCGLLFFEFTIIYVFCYLEKRRCETR